MFISDPDPRFDTKEDNAILHYSSTLICLPRKIGFSVPAEGQKNTFQKEGAAFKDTIFELFQHNLKERLEKKTESGTRL